MEYYTALVATLSCIATGAALYCCIRPAKSKPGTIPEKDMESIMAFAAYLKDMPENKSYTTAWNYMKKHQEEHPDAPKPRLRRKHGNYKAK